MAEFLKAVSEVELQNHSSYRKHNKTIITFNNLVLFIIKLNYSYYFLFVCHI